MKKVFAVLALLLAFIGNKVAADDTFDVAAKHAIAVEASTGKVLYEKDATTPDWYCFNDKNINGLFNLQRNRQRESKLGY